MARLTGSQVVPGERIDEALDYLGWSVKDHRTKGLNGEEENVWSRYSKLEEKFFAWQVDTYMQKIARVDVDQSVVNSILNLLKNAQKSPVILTRQIQTSGKDKKDNLAVIVGIGDIWVVNVGIGGFESGGTTKLIMETVMSWVSNFKNKNELMGSEAVCNGLKGSSELQEFIAQKKLEDETVLFVNIPETLVPYSAKESVLEMAKSRQFGHWQCWLRTKNNRKRCHPGKYMEIQRVTNFRKKGGKLVSLLGEIKFTCLLKNDSICGLLSVFDESTWLEQKDKVMDRAWSSVALWPFVSFDTEGCGIWFQVGFYGATGWECSVFGPCYFPVEMMEFLESELTIVTGKGIHEDLWWILGKSAGWRALDLAVWTRDLKFHGHEENGLKRQIQEAIGFNMKLLKSMKGQEKDIKERFGYIRSGNWATQTLDSRQLAYMASDVTLSGTVVFDRLVCTIMELGINVLDQHFSNLAEFVDPFVNKLIDRQWNDKKQHITHQVRPEKRSLVECIAGLELSVDVAEGHGDDTKDEERRMKQQQLIVERGWETFRKGKISQKIPGPMWCKNPERRRYTGHAEVLEKEELWEV